MRKSIHKSYDAPEGGSGQPISLRTPPYIKDLYREWGKRLILAIHDLSICILFLKYKANGNFSYPCVMANVCQIQDYLTQHDICILYFRFN